jgi:uncharacterized protein YuzE
VHTPDHESVQDDGRIRRWARIGEMGGRYTDTLYIELRPAAVSETRELDESTTLELDQEGSVCAITFEHASTRSDLQKLTVEVAT